MYNKGTTLFIYPGQLNYFKKNFLLFGYEKDVRNSTVCPFHNFRYKILSKQRLSFETRQENTGLFISPSGTSKLDCATTNIDRAERSISIGRESLKVLFCTRGLGVLAGSTARG